MRTYVWAVALFLFLSHWSTMSRAEQYPYVEGEVLVRYSSSVTPEDKLVLNATIGMQTLHEHKMVPNLELVQIPNDQTVEEAIEYLEQTPGVMYASPNYIIRLEAGIFPPGGDKPKNPDSPFNDPFLYRSYGIEMVGAVKTWNQFTTGSHEVIVAIIDTGIDYLHDDLKTNIWVNAKEIPDNRIDDDENGFVDDIHGWNFVSNNNIPLDDSRHGTHVAGTVGAVADNGLGTIGVSPKITMMAVKFLDDEGKGTLSSAVNAIEYAVVNGAKILNNSWGGSVFSQALLDAINEANKLGVIFVAAAGNRGENSDEKPVYPASFDAENIISVAATNRRDNMASYSNYGKMSVDLGAPGDAVYSTFPNDRYGYLDGTSMATPHVVGVAALIWAHKPNLTMKEIKDLIFNSVDPLADLQGVTVTGGRVNSFNALALGLFSP